VEILLVLGIVFGGAWAYNKSKAPAAVPPVVVPPIVPPYVPPPLPPPVLPPINVGPKPPGIYPPGTPGTIPFTISVAGGDGDSYVQATTPGGGDTAGPSPGSKILWLGPGTWVNLKAWVVPFGPSWLPQLTAFDHWEGPGGTSSRSNPLAVQVNTLGFARGVFAFLGQAGR
jgi:hypothetical protein